jgi:tetratricopeptide (TPR) repeat protein
LLLDCREYVRGYALYLSLPWKTHGEQKYYGMSWALIKMKNYGEARRILKKGLKRFPESSTLTITKGILQLATHHYIRALQSFEHAFDLDPCNLDALYYKAFSLDLLGLYEEAVPILQYLTEEYPDDHCFLVEMGLSCFMTGYVEDAFEYYRRAQETGRKSGDMYCGLYCTYSHLGFQDEALYIAQEGLKEYPDEPAMYDNLGECY